MEARVRAPVASYDQRDGLRSPYFDGIDSSGRVVSVWIWSTGVALSTDQSADRGPGLAMIAFDAATAAHTYTVVTDSAGASMRIDGVERLRLPYTTFHASARNRISFGNDSRRSGEAFTEWQYVRFSTIRHPSDSKICPSGTAAFTVTAAGSGPITYQWQWQPAGTGTTWTPLTAGENAEAGGMPVINAANADTGTLVARPLAGYINFAPRKLRCTITNACGSITSEEATLTVCPADFNCDGFLDFFDYDDYVNCFETGACGGGGGGTADFNGDDFVDFFDYDDFVAAFETGC